MVSNIIIKYMLLNCPERKKKGLFDYPRNFIVRNSTRLPPPITLNTLLKIVK